VDLRTGPSGTCDGEEGGGGGVFSSHTRGICGPPAQFVFLDEGNTSRGNFSPYSTRLPPAVDRGERPAAIGFCRQLGRASLRTALKMDLVNAALAALVRQGPCQRASSTPGSRCDDLIMNGVGHGLLADFYPFTRDPPSAGPIARRWRVRCPENATAVPAPMSARPVDAVVRGRGLSQPGGFL
jgi:hypothetical protein